MRQHLRSAFFVCAVFVPSLAVAAEVRPVAPAPRLEPLSLQQLDAATARARTEVPAVFSGVRSVVAHADELDAKKRGRFFPMTPLLRDIARAGQGHGGAALALVEPLVHPERFTLPVKDSALIALRAGLLEAAGDLKDPLAAPVYRALVHEGGDFHVVGAAAGALGKLALDADVAELARLALTPGPSQDAVIGGLGSCRRLAAAVALAEVANAQPPRQRASLVVASLGRLASAWALAIPNAAPAAELPALRQTASSGALTIYLEATDPTLRDQASDALMAIDAPELVTLIDQARGRGTGAQQLALSALRSRYDRNPTRGSR